MEDIPGQEKAREEYPVPPNAPYGTIDEFRKYYRRERLRLILLIFPAATLGFAMLICAVAWTVPMLLVPAIVLIVFSMIAGTIGAHRLFESPYSRGYRPYL